MKKTLLALSFGLIAIALVIKLAGGPSGKLEDSVASTKIALKTTKETIKVNKQGWGKSKLKTKYAEHIADKDFNNVFDKELKSWKLQETKVEKLSKDLKDYNSDNASNMAKSAKEINFDLRRIKNNVEYPLNFVRELDKAMKLKDSTYKTVTELYKPLKKKMDPYAEHMDKYAKKYSEKKKVINKMKESVVGLYAQVNKTYKKFEKEYNSKKINIVKYMDYSKTLNRDIEKLNKDIYDYWKRVEELDRDYTKILVDMKEVPTLSVERISWNNSYDYPTEHKYTYKDIIMDNETYKYFISLNTDFIAKSTSGVFDKDMKPLTAISGVSQRYVNKLRLNVKENWNSGDDDAEFYIKNMGATYAHKYRIMEDGKSKVTEWVIVSAAIYNMYLKNLGMEIVSKPIGYFESEKSTRPTPEGMSRVNNPHYGEWKQDSSGNSFWHYYGMYSMFGHIFGSNDHRYYRNDYNRYHGSSGAYYGNGRYGSNGTYTRNRYKSSTFNKTGGYKSATTRSTKRSSYRKSKTTRSLSKRSSSSRPSRSSSSSFRSSGSKTRSRGPGKGGK